MNQFAVLAVIVIAMNGCTPIGPYRTKLEDSNSLCVATTSNDCPTDALFKLQTDLDYEIPLAIIEFDDQGVLQSRDFKDSMMADIRSLGADEDVLVVVFAHGWKNNAAPNNGNLDKFQMMLRKLATADYEMCEGHSCAKRKVVGVYMAWRGLSARHEPAKLLSFWNRKARAHRVGQDGAAEVLAELRKIKAQRDNNRLVVIGHSFGGALVFSAVQQILIRGTAFLQSGDVPRNAADLVVLINPAFEAARLTAIHDKAARMDFEQSQRPILGIFTSTTDQATKRMFPIGRRMSNFFTKYNPRFPSQKKLNTTAIGHYSDYQTHTLKADLENEIVSLRASVCAWQDFQTDSEIDDWELGGVRLTRNPGVRQSGQRNNPYYNVAVADEVISGHNGIWTERFMEFLYRFVAAQEARPSACRRAQ